MRCQEVPVMDLSYAVTVLYICVHKCTKGPRTKHKHKKENVKTASLKKASQLHGATP